MKLYKLFSLGLVAVTSLAMTSLAANALVSSKKPWIIPEHCYSRTASVDHGVLVLGIDGFEDDSAGFGVRTTFAGGGHGRLDLSFEANTLSFILTDTNGAPITTNIEAESFLENGSNSPLFRKAFPDANGFVNLIYNASHTTHQFADEIQVVINGTDGVARTVLVSHFLLNGNQGVGLDTTHAADAALRCD